MTTRRRIKPVAVHVVMDTNALFTDRADKLLSPQISDFIIHASKNTGNDIFWYLPSMVRKERHYQMLQSGLKLVPSVKKIESLLGIDLQINVEKLDSRVSEAIDRQISLHGLRQIEPDYSKIDWASLIDNAAFRKPPFSESGEKGFKDAIILETFLQFVDSLPKSGCRIILLTSDTTLKESSMQRTSTASNATIIANLDDLKNLLHAIASHLPEDQIERLQNLAAPLFWTKDDNTCLWIKSSLGLKVNEAVSAAAPSPGDGFRLLPGGITIGKPAFISKEGQKISFRQKIVQEVTAKKPVRKAPSNFSSPPQIGGLLGLGDVDVNKPKLETSFNLAKLGSLIGTLTTDEITQSGRHILEATWETTLMRRGLLASPKLIAVNYQETEWSEPSFVGADQQAAGV